MAQKDELIKILEECKKVVDALALGGGMSYDRLYMIDLAGRIRLATRVVQDAASIAPPTG